VGKTANNNTTQGIRMVGSAGFTSFVRDGDLPVLMNRLTSDGTILNFEKDNTSIGQIGAYLGSAYIQGNSNSSGFLFGNSNVYPWDAGALSDGNIELGNASYRWNNIYLSGGVHLGGTGSANKLDDYEEGTFTPLFYGGSSGTAENSSSGYYTKIGRLVTVQVDVYNKTFGTYSGDLRMTLPFTAHTRPASGGDVYFYPNSAWDGVSNFVGFTPRAYDTAYLTFGLITNDSDRQTNIGSSNTSTSGASGIFLRFSFTYTTNS
jgi:hypothetical protein